MSMTASELLDALDRSGSADSTIEAGRKFVRLMKDEDAGNLVNHLQEMGVTEGTIHKAKDLLSGRKKPEDYQGVPPPNSKEADTRRLAKMLGEEMGRVLSEQQTRQSERQADAQAAGVGDPVRAKQHLQTSAGKR